MTLQKNVYGKGIRTDSQEHALHTVTGHRDPRYGLSYDHIQPKVEDIHDVKEHPAHNLPRPQGGGEEPLSSVSHAKGNPKMVKKPPYSDQGRMTDHAGSPGL